MKYGTPRLLDPANVLPYGYEQSLRDHRLASYQRRGCMWISLQSSECPSIYVLCHAPHLARRAGVGHVSSIRELFTHMQAERPQAKVASASGTSCRVVSLRGSTQVHAEPLCSLHLRFSTRSQRIRKGPGSCVARSDTLILALTQFSSIPDAAYLCWPTQDW